MRLLPRITAAMIMVGVAVLGSAATIAGAAGSPVPVKKLHSFEFTVSIKITGAGTGSFTTLDLTSTGVFTAPTNQDCKITAKLGTVNLTRQAVVIGKKTWVDTGSGLEAAKPKDFDFADLCASDASFWSDVKIKPPAAPAATQEDLNGTSTDHYDLGNAANTLSGFGALGDLPDDVVISDMQQWYARKGGWLAGLQVQMSSAATDSCSSIASAIPITIEAPCAIALSYELANANGKNLAVKAPKTKK